MTHTAVLPANPLNPCARPGPCHSPPANCLPLPLPLPLPCTATEMQPLKLSLCGATALTHDAVSALLRLPILTELDIGGCCRIIAMDKMRLVAKVCVGGRGRAGEWWEGWLGGRGQGGLCMQSWAAAALLPWTRCAW